MRKISRIIREPWFINFLQIISYLLGVACGLLASTGGIPNIVNFQLGPVLSVIVGSVLAGAGALGAYSVYKGYWGLEQAALWALGVGYVALLVPTIVYAFTPGRTSSTIWLIVYLETQAILAAMIRYRRIDWAYLDPAK